MAPANIALTCPQLRELHEIRSAAGRIQHELEFMWEKVDVLTKYPVSIRARAPSSDQSEEDIDPEEVMFGPLRY